MKVFTYILVATAFALSSFFSKAEAAPNKMVAIILLTAEDNDKTTATTIYTTFMAAEKIANMLDIEMSASEEAVDDVFVFSLKSQEQKELTMKMFDEEGYEIAAHRVMSVDEGQNYKALNVQSLEDGTYHFQLTDTEGKELSRTVTILRDEK